MIGYFIKGTDLQGKPCEGLVLDKIICPQSVSLGGQRGQIGSTQSLPMPLTAYIIFDKDQRSIHIIGPQSITDIGFPEPEPQGPDKVALNFAHG